MGQHFFDEGTCEDCGALQSTKTTTCEQYRAGKHCPSCACDEQNTSDWDCVVLFPNGKAFHMSCEEMCELLVAGRKHHCKRGDDMNAPIGEAVPSMKEKVEVMLDVLPISDSY